MHFVSFDTHKYIKELQASGFNEKQAEVIIKSLLESRDYDLSKLATREQVNEIKSDLQKEISAVREQIAKIENNIELIHKDIEKFATREQVANIEKELEKFATREQLIEVKSEIKEEINATREQITKIENNILKWMIPFFLGIIVSIIGIIATILIKLS